MNQNQDSQDNEQNKQEKTIQYEKSQEIKQPDVTQNNQNNNGNLNQQQSNDNISQEMSEEQDKNSQYSQSLTIEEESKSSYQSQTLGTQNQQSQSLNSLSPLVKLKSIKIPIESEYKSKIFPCKDTLILKVIDNHEAFKKKLEQMKQHYNTHFKFVNTLEQCYIEKKFGAQDMYYEEQEQLDDFIYHLMDQEVYEAVDQNKQFYVMNQEQSEYCFQYLKDHDKNYNQLELTYYNYEGIKKSSNVSFDQQEELLVYKSCKQIFQIGFQFKLASINCVNNISQFEQFDALLLNVDQNLIFTDSVGLQLSNCCDGLKSFKKVWKNDQSVQKLFQEQKFMANIQQQPYKDEQNKNEKYFFFSLQGKGQENLKNLIALLNQGQLQQCKKKKNKIAIVLENDQKAEPYFKYFFSYLESIHQLNKTDCPAKNIQFYFILNNQQQIEANDYLQKVSEVNLIYPEQFQYCGEWIFEHHRQTINEQCQIILERAFAQNLKGVYLMLQTDFHNNIKTQEPQTEIATSVVNLQLMTETYLNNKTHFRKIQWVDSKFYYQDSPEQQPQLYEETLQLYFAFMIDNMITLFQIERNQQQNHALSSILGYVSLIENRLEIINYNPQSTQSQQQTFQIRRLINTKLKLEDYNQIINQRVKQQLIPRFIINLDHNFEKTAKQQQENNKENNKNCILIRGVEQQVEQFLKVIDKEMKEKKIRHVLCNKQDILKTTNTGYLERIAKQKELLVIKEPNKISLEGYQKTIQLHRSQLYRDLFVKFDDQMPLSWINVENNLELIKLEPHEQDYKIAEAEFKKTLPNNKTISIHRIQNKLLWKTYCFEKQKLLQRGVDGSDTYLFHGIRFGHPETIYKSDEGYDPRFAAETGMWGPGIYFGNAITSMLYSFLTKNKSLIFLLNKVLLGNVHTCQHDNSIRIPPFLPGSTTERYDSIHGIDQRLIYIIYQSGRAYPEFLYEYENYQGQYR